MKGNARKEYPFSKYKFKVDGHTVTAYSRFAGEEVKATAKCHPDDEFDAMTGMKIAAARCNAKVCKRRIKMINETLDYLNYVVKDIQSDIEKTTDYLEDATAAYEDAIKKIMEIEGQI